MDGLKVVFEAIKERFHKEYSFDEFLRDFNGWDFQYIFKGEKCIGAAFSKEGFIHIGIDKEYRNKWATRSKIAALIQNSMIDGKAYTTILKNDTYRTTFAKRLGFKLIEDGEIQTYEVKHEAIWK